MASSVQVLSLRDRTRWQDALGKTPGGGEPCFQPAFYAAAEALGSGRVQAECFVYSEEPQTLVYPYLRRKLNTLPFIPQDSPCCDIAGGYGYNGAAASSEDPAFLARFREAFGRHCRQTHVITEFVRFHPLLDNARLFASDCDILVQNKNVAVDLRRPLSEIRAGYERSCRKNIKKAAREGVSVFVEEGPGPTFEEFLRIYADTMTRVAAADTYAFSTEYFRTLAADLVPVPLFAYARYQGKIVSAEMVLRSSDYLYSYLGGTDAAAFASRPNNALKDAVIKWGSRAGCRAFLLGGGQTPGDGIFRYKRTFSPDGVIDFKIGLRVHDQKGYAVVLERWSAAAAREPNKRLQRYWD